MENNSYFFSVRIEKTKVIYKIIKNNVRSNGSARPSSPLVIAISIPRGYELAGNISPYDVLIDLKDEFIKLCMTYRDAHSGIYEYNSGRINTNALDHIIQKYALRPTGRKYTEMTNNDAIGYVIMPEENIKLLMSDIRYDVFSNYKEIVIAENVGQATGFSIIKDLVVPRPKEYTIFDGEIESIRVTDIKKPYIIESNENAKYYNNGKLTFTIEDLINNPYLSSAIRFDADNEAVYLDRKKLATRKQQTQDNTNMPTSNAMRNNAGSPDTVAVTLSIPKSKETEEIISRKELLVTIKSESPTKKEVKLHKENQETYYGKLPINSSWLRAGVTLSFQTKENRYSYHLSDKTKFPFTINVPIVKKKNKSLLGSGINKDLKILLAVILLGCLLGVLGTIYLGRNAKKKVSNEVVESKERPATDSDTTLFKETNKQSAGEIGSSKKDNDNLNNNAKRSKNTRDNSNAEIEIKTTSEESGARPKGTTTEGNISKKRGGERKDDKK
ncbi:MAG: hypothetical protein PUG74_10620 [Prevotellaceae bacterium]|nr:hypothetical protein [Prevotellaceae bacterium]